MPLIRALGLANLLAAAAVLLLPVLLDRWAWDGAIGAVHAAVVRLWLQHRVALLTLVEPLAGVRRHCLHFGVSAFRASQR